MLTIFKFAKYAHSIVEDYSVPLHSENRWKARDNSSQYGYLSENSILILVFIVLTCTAPESIFSCRGQDTRVMETGCP